MSKRVTAFVIGLFLLLSSGAMLMWRAEEMHTITGDEPHYLVIADGLLPTFELEQSGPYSREFQNRTIVEAGLAARTAVPSPQNTHAEIGPHGLFNVHNLGLPALVAIPYLLGGELGARFAMILIAAVAIFLILKLLALTGVSPRGQLLIALPLCLGLPFVSGASQIYPDLPGGTLCLLGAYMLFRGPRPNHRLDGLVTAILVAYLPWLHIRFSLPMGIILIAMSIKWRGTVSLSTLLARFWLPAFVSLMLLAAYNTYAFGHASGPYQSGDMMLNRIAIMQLLGLLFDQNQGILMQQPLHFVGLYYFAQTARKHFLATATALFVALSLIGPNATHWNLYGGWSFSGRFGWAATVVLMSITVFGVSQLWAEYRRVAYLALTASMLVQLRHLVAIFIQKRTLFPHIFDGWIGTYSTFWSSIETWLPQWRDYRWAFSYVPNYVFISAAVALLVLGANSVRAAKLQRNLLLTCGACSLVVLGAFARFGDMPFPQQKWAATQLFSQIGTTDNLSRVASADTKKGLLTYGPYWDVPAGQYEVGIQYSSKNSPTNNGILDIYIANKNVVLTAVPLAPTQGENNQVFVPITVSTNNAGKIELRTMYEGVGELRVDWIQLRRVSDNIPE